MIFLGAGFLANTVGRILIWFLLLIDALIYSLISFTYQIIMILSNANILKNGTGVSALIGRVYTIIGVVVLFFVAYSLLRAMINTDDLVKGKKSPVKIIKDVVTSVILIAIVPIVFDFAYKFQSSLLEYNTIGKIILGNPVNGDGSTAIDSTQNGGMTIATNILGAFLHENFSNSKVCQLDSSSNTSYKCEITVDGVSFSEYWQKIRDSGHFFGIESFVDNIVNSEMSYFYIGSSVAGIFTLFVLLSYCMNIAVRSIKLSVYQLIAPLPILCRVVPDDSINKVFSNWVKAVVSTFLEVFIRLGILFFAIFIINVFIDNFANIFTESLFNSGGFLLIRPFVIAFFIMGIILFVQEFPNFIKELTGLDGNKYSVLKSAKQGFSFIGGGVAALGSGSVNPLANMASGFNAWRQAGNSKISDFSSIGQQYKRREAINRAKEDAKRDNPNGRSRLMNGWSLLRNRLVDSASTNLGFGTAQERADAKLKRNQDLDGNYFEATNDSDVEIKTKKTIAKGDKVRADSQTMQELGEREAEINILKDKVQNEVNKRDEWIKGNTKLTELNKQLGDRAIDQINKNKVNLVRSDGTALEFKFRYFENDAYGHKVLKTSSITDASKAQFENWLETNKNKMSDSERSEFVKKLGQAVQDTKKKYIDNDGLISGATKIDTDLVNIKNEALANLTHGYRDASGDIQTKISYIDSNNVVQTIDLSSISASGISAEVAGEIENAMKTQISAIKTSKDYTNAISERNNLELESKGITHLREQFKLQAKSEEASDKYQAVKSATEVNKMRNQGGKGGS